MNECVFCQIASHALTSCVVYEDEFTCVFMDAAEDVDGHMLAIPKQHFESILDCDETMLHHLMDTVKHVASHCVSHCGYEGVNLLNASGACAGQSIPHFHIHMIPRKRGDGINAWPRLPGSISPIETIYQRVKDGLS